MRINDLIDLSEMAIPVSEGPKVWKKINTLIHAGDYKTAAKYYIDAGGSPLSIKRTWNTAIGKPKSSGKPATGPLAGTLEKDLTDEDLKKFMDAIPKEAIKKVKDAKAASNEKKKSRIEKNISNTDNGEPPELSHEKASEFAKGNEEAGKVVGRYTGDTAEVIAGSKQAASIRKIAKAFNIEGKEALNLLKNRAKELKLRSKDFQRYADIKKKSFENRTPDERKEFSNLKRKLLTIMPSDIIAKTAIYDFKNVKTVKEFKDLIKFYENDVRKQITNANFTKTILNTIKKITKPETQERKDLLYATKPITGAKKGSDVKSLNSKLRNNSVEGVAHAKQVDKFLDKYNSGADIKQKDLADLTKEIEKMLPIMKEEQNYDPKGFGIYSQTLRKLKEFLSKVSSNPDSTLDIDDVEEATSKFTQYHEKIKKEIDKENKRSIKEDIMYNLK